MAIKRLKPRAQDQPVGEVGSCRFWDYDHDSRHDIYVSGMAEAWKIGWRRTWTNPRPWGTTQNLPEPLASATSPLRLDSPGANLGDIDEDGFLDVVRVTGMELDSTAPPGQGIGQITRFLSNATYVNN